MTDYRVQEPPYCIQMEAVQGCNLGCSFCGIHQIGYNQKQRGMDYMDPEAAENIAKQVGELGWNPRIEFAMHGEPTMHPALADLIRPFREHLPKAHLMVTSNGGGLLQDTAERVEALFDAGLNTLALDDYQTNKITDRIRRNLKEAAFLVPIYDYPAEKDANPHHRFTGQRIVVIEDIGIASSGTHATLNNHAGSAFPLDYSKDDKRCAKPFRELSIRWNADVAICCNDWPGVYKCGNAVRDGVGAVWQSNQMGAARTALYNGRRDVLLPCHGCNATSYRPGLLPDPTGKASVPEPTEDDQWIMDAAASGAPYTSVVRPALAPADGVFIPLSEVSRSR